MVVKANLDIDRGLVLHLPMTEGAGTKIFDLSQYDKFGDILGGAWADSASGKVISFDGTNGQGIDLDSVLSIAADGVYDPFSASIWFKLNGAAGGDVSGFHFLFVEITGNGNRAVIYVKSDGTQTSFQVKDNGGTTITHTFDSNFIDGVEHLIVYTCTGTLIKGYLDGKLIQSWSIDGVQRGVTKPRLGSRDATSYATNGEIRNARVYGRVISEREVETLSKQRRRV